MFWFVVICHFMQLFAFSEDRQNYFTLDTGLDHLDSQTMSIWWGNPEFWHCVRAWNALSWIHMCETGCRLNCSRLFRDHRSTSRSPTQPWGTSHTFGMHTHTWHYTTMNQHIRTLKIFPKFSLTSSTYPTMGRATFANKVKTWLHLAGAQMLWIVPSADLTKVINFYFH